MDIVEFRKKQSAFHDKTRKRQVERMNANDDTPYHIALLEEMIMDLIQRVEKIEAFYEPAPEEEVVHSLGRPSGA